MGIEFVDEYEMQYYLKNTNFFRKKTLGFARKIQILGIQDCKKKFFLYNDKILHTKL